MSWKATFKNLFQKSKFTTVDEYIDIGRLVTQSFSIKMHPELSN